MAKIRVYELAKKLGKPSAQLLDELRALGVDVSSNFSTLDESDMVKIATGAKPLERISKPLPTKK